MSVVSWSLVTIFDQSPPFRIGEVATRGDVEFPIVPRAPNDLTFPYPTQPTGLVGREFGGAAEQTQTERSALVRAVVGDRVQCAADVVHPDAELADVHQFHRTRRYFVDACHPVWGVDLLYSCWLLTGQLFYVGVGNGRKRLNILGAIATQ